MPLFPCTTREAGPVFTLGQLVYANGHLNLKWGHSLNTMYSHLAANLLAKNTRNRPSWELNFQIFQTPLGITLGVLLGSRKSYPLLDQILQILWPYIRPEMLKLFLISVFCEWSC